jgi:hypothetical protein
MLGSLVVAGLLLAGCGGSSKPTPTATASTPAVAVPNPAAAMQTLIAGDPSLGGIVHTLYQGSSWSVVESTSPGKASAVAFRLVDNQWRADRTGKVKISILGPQPGEKVATTLPQVAIEFAAKQPFVESALWVDGTELEEKGGGSPTRGTIYGAPAKRLAPGSHVAVGYARTGTTGTAVAWTFVVK